MEIRRYGPRIAAETAGVQADDRRQEMRERFERIAEKFEMTATRDIQQLIYEDPDRADVAEWLDAHGWTATAVSSKQEMRRLDRWALPADLTDEDAFSNFVTAEKLP